MHVHARDVRRAVALEPEDEIADDEIVEVGDEHRGVDVPDRVGPAISDRLVLGEPSIAAASTDESGTSLPLEVDERSPILGRRRTNHRVEHVRPVGVARSCRARCGDDGGSVRTARPPSALLGRAS